MKYLCLVYHEEAKLAALSYAEMDALVAGCVEWAGELEKSGHHLLSSGLQTVSAAATVRNRGGTVSITDGPFAVREEFLSGFVYLDQHPRPERSTATGREVPPGPSLEASKCDPRSRPTSRRRRGPVHCRRLPPPRGPP